MPHILPMRRACAATVLVAVLGASVVSVSALRAQCANDFLPGDTAPGVSGPGAPRVDCSTSFDPDGAGPLPPIVAFGGPFTAAGAAVARNAATYDPASGAFAPLGIGVDSAPSCMLGLPNGTLVAGGLQPLAGGSVLALWNGTAWTPIAGVSGAVRALALLPNGDVVAGGSLSFAGLGATQVARWNGATWLPFGSGIPSGAVHALCVRPNGDLVAGGTFTTAGTSATSRIARWDGTAWTPLGSGCSGTVLALAAQANGDVLVGGEFLTAGGLPTNRVARWDGTTWSVMQSGANFHVRSLAVLPNGHVVAGGDFTAMGGTQSLRIARWNGGGWTAVTPGFGENIASVRSLTALANGDFFVGGHFRHLGWPVQPDGYSIGVARGANATVEPIVGGTVGSVFASLATAGGDLVVGGDLELVDDTFVVGLARRSAGTWQPLGQGAEGVRALAELPGGDLVVGGYFTTTGGMPSAALARWDGTAWSAFGPLVGPGLLIPFVRALTTMPNGDLVVGGGFTSAGGVPAGNVARWNGATWDGLGGGVGGPSVSTTVLASAALPNGDLVVGGWFTTAGGQPAANVARWDGSSWSALGTGLDHAVYALAVLPNGDVVAGGGFDTAGGVPANRIARWDGTAWTPLGTGIAGGDQALVLALRALPNGDLLAGGDFTVAGGVAANRLARWNGSSWSAVGSGTDGVVWSLGRMANDDVLVGGAFAVVDGAPSAAMAQLTTSCPAVAVPAGAGCNGQVLTASSLPWVDATFRATATGLPANALCVAVTSFTALQPGLPLANVLLQGQPGCALHVAPDILGLVAALGGVAESSFALPSTPPIVGLTFHHQLVPVELDASLQIVAITATNALALTAGAF